MNNVRIAAITIKGVFRDKVFRGILMTALAFFVIPSISSLSMRQVTALSMTYLCLSSHSSCCCFLFFRWDVALEGHGPSLYYKRPEPANNAHFLYHGKIPRPCGVYPSHNAAAGRVAFIVIWYVANVYPPIADLRDKFFIRSHFWRPKVHSAHSLCLSVLHREHIVFSAYFRLNFHLLRWFCHSAGLWICHISCRRCLLPIVP